MQTNQRSVPVQDDADNDLDVTPSALGEADAYSKPTQEEISVVAHQIYEEEGCPDGLADCHWHAAEALLQQ